MIQHQKLPVFVLFLITAGLFTYTIFSGTEVAAFALVLTLLCAGGALLLRVKKSLLMILLAGGIVALLGGEIVGSPLLLLVIALLLGGSYLTQKDAGKLYWSHIWGVALVVRGLFLFFPESDDIYRYIWEGLIQHEGFNPFQLAPDAAQLSHIDFIYHDKINHPDFATIYWPVAQLLFRAVTLFSNSPLVMKAVLVLFDLGILVVLSKLIPQTKKSSLVWYAFNPVVLFGVAGEGHLEVMPVFFIVLAYYFYKKRQNAFIYIALGFAIFTKVNYLLFLPFFIRKNNWKWLPVTLLPLILFIPYIAPGTNPLLVPFRFGGEFAWNGPLFTLFSLVLPQKLVYLTNISLLLISFVVLCFTAATKREFILKGGILFLLFTPTLHYWYIIMITPFLVLSRSRPWLLLHGTIFFVGFYFHPNTEATLFKNLGLMQLAAFIPPLLLFFGEVRSRIILKTKESASGKDLSIILPVLNEGPRLKEKIKTLLDYVPHAEIIVVDGGSHDETLSILDELPVITLHSSAGRGIQIKEGVDTASRGTTIILHADTTPSKETLHRIETVMADDHQIIGGACGMRYNNRGGYFPLIETMNSLKVLLFGISFGDQMQFFRREKVANHFPDYFLMEDMELSMRMRNLGKTVYLPLGVEVSSRRWMKHGFMKNVTTVVRLVLKFLFLRQIRAIDDRCESFYREYYGK